MIYQYCCDVCGREFEEVRSYKDRNEVFCCGKKAIKLICSSFYTDKDRAYNFTTSVFNGKPIEISSKQQYKNLMKQHRMADCSIKESLLVKPKDHVALNKPKRQQIAKKIAERVQREGLSHVVPKFMKDVIFKEKPIKS